MRFLGAAAGVAALVVVMVTTVVPAQDVASRPASRPRLPPLDEKAQRLKAQRLVTFLELPARRREAARGLLAMGADALPPLKRALADPRPEVVFRVVQVLRFLGPDAAPALPDLQRLGKSKDAGLSEAARLGLATLPPRGRIGAVDRSNQLILEVDLLGKVVGKTRIDGIYDAQPLGNRCYLVSRFSDGKVVEVDADGKVQWTYDGCKSPLRVERLPNGNTLIAGARSKVVQEVDRRGKVVFEHKSTWPNDADRLPCGNTLVSDYQGRSLVEVDPAGKVAWQLRVPEGPIEVQRLRNGNTLTVLHDSQLIRELDPEGKSVWKVGGIKEPKSALRLANGWTIVSAKGVIAAFDAQGKRLWEVNSAGEVVGLWEF